MALQESGEMYLETIYVLSLESDEVRAIDIGEHMNYSKPSVSRAMGLLIKDGYISRDKDGFIKLTKSGEKIAKRIYERHTVLSELLMPAGSSIISAKRPSTPSRRISNSMVRARHKRSLNAKHRQTA